MMQKKGKEMYCHYCRARIKKVINKKGEPFKPFGANCFCPDCWEKVFYGKRPTTKHVFCVFCGDKIEFKRRFPHIRYCEKCELLVRTPKKYAYSMNKRYPEKIKVIYECGCGTNRKINHHPNYQQPFLVERLCFSCHGRAHNGHDYKTKTSNG